MFASLHIASFRWYAAGMAGSNVGTWMHRVAQAWLVLQLTGEPFMLGVATALQFAPMLFVGPWAGALADRTDRRRLLIASQLALALQAAVLAVLVLTGAATTAVVLGAALVLGVVTAIDGPARQSFVSDLVDRRTLPNAVALNASSFNAARLIGPALAGLVIAAWGTGVVFAVNAATFSIMLIALLHIRVDSGPRADRRRATVADGIRYVSGHRDLTFVILTVGLVAMLVLNFQMTIAIMSTEAFGVGPELYGVLASLMAVGSLTGSLIAAKRSRTSLGLVTSAAVTLSLGTVVAGLAPGPAAFAATLMLIGVSALLMMTGANAYIQTHTSAQHRSRVMALYLALFFGTTLAGAPLVGWIAGTAGPRAGLILPGLLALASVVALRIWLRRGDRTRPLAVQRHGSAVRVALAA